MLPSDQHEVEYLNSVAKEKFADYLSTDMQVCRPWIWADGLDAHVQARLIELLLQHGVPQDAVESRAKIVTNGLSVSAVQKAVTGTAPWRSLKAIANQATPVVQLVLPDELAAVIKSEESGGFSKKQKKRPDTKKIVPNVPVSLDPTKLQLAPETFVDEAGKPLMQIPVEALGPSVVGIALATCADIEHFLKSGRPISDSAVGVFVLNAAEHQITTHLPWFQCRIAMRCTANGEPVLVTGYLIQLGQGVISMARRNNVVEAGEVQATCVKVAVYRDCYQGSWEEFTKSPVRYILQTLTPLQVCEQSEPCSCEKWHRSSSCTIRDPVLDVWRRQWLGMNFRPMQPHQADLFVVNLRYVKEIEDLVLSSSGKNALFLEPRSVDSRQPNHDYQVIWMARSTLAELTHMARTIPEIVGVARLGSRLGIRTKLEHVTQVGQQVKPDAILLAAGVKLDYEAGPVPYGMDRASVAALFASIGWKVKPIGPVRSVDGGLGVIWHLHATTEPTNVVFATKHGEIVVTKREPKSQAMHQIVSPMVPSTATMQLCSLTCQSSQAEDPFLKNDPWSQLIESQTC